MRELKHLCDSWRWKRGRGGDPELLRDEQEWAFFCFLSPSLVPVENPNWDVKLLLVPIEPPEIKDWSLLSRQRSPGWKTGTKGSFQSGQHALSAIV